jgi:hypothetical protein
MDNSKRLIDSEQSAAPLDDEETAVGSQPSPEENVVDEIGREMGVEYADSEPLKVGEKERSRDMHRWELDPASSEDYIERVRDEDR